MIIDSGHGLHCYWMLKEPILDISKADRFHFKQILSGIADELRADKQVIFLNCLLRLPGTLNIKRKETKECKIIYQNMDRFYALEDFEKFINTEYQEPEPADKTTFDFGREDTVLISAKNQKDAFADIDKLEVTDETKMHIKTGAPLTKKGADDTRSARDMSIICALVSFDYNYKTIESIFLNPHLGCSNRIIGKGQKGGILALHWDVGRALKFVKKCDESLTPERREYRRLKYEKKVLRQMKLGNCCKYVTENLVSGKPPIGEYFKNDDEKARYYFDKKNKRLMDIKSTDFECFTRIRYGIQSDDWEEVKKTVRDAIWDKGKEIESHNTMYYDKKKDTIYYDNGAAGVYRLRDGKIELIDHGTDGIFFKTNTEYTPFELVDSSKVTNYFERERESKITIKKIGTLKLGKRKVYGFDMVRFMRSDSYVKKYLIDVCNFGMTEKGIAPEEQKFLLILYFYGLFFESIMSEKLIACFVGQKETGKSTIATLIGKILFGDKFLTRDFPENKKDMEVSMGNNYYLPLDNVDHNVPANMLDVLCQASTGGLIEKRKLWTDDESVKIRPHVWLIITTREAKFKRDDMISRLLLFDT